MPPRTRRTKDSSPSQFRVLSLSATVLAGGIRPTATQDEVCEVLDVTPPTIRDWCRRGMPVQGTPARPRYVWPDVFTWAACFRERVRKDGHRGPRHLSIEEAHEWHLDLQRDMDPAAFVIVPLAHDHPAREAQVRRAAAGFAPPAEDIEDVD